MTQALILAVVLLAMFFIGRATKSRSSSLKSALQLNVINATTVGGVFGFNRDSMAQFAESILRKVDELSSEKDMDTKQIFTYFINGPYSDIELCMVFHILGLKIGRDTGKEEFEIEQLKAKLAILRDIITSAKDEKSAETSDTPKTQSS